jgi:5-methylcytosine-specific restriction endonuclease McrA
MEYNNPDVVKRNRDRWKKDNPERVRENDRTRRMKNPLKRRESDSKYRQGNKEKRSAYQSEWQKGNKSKVSSYWHKRRAQKTEAGGSYTESEWKALCKRYDYRCACCGKKKILTFDHVVPISKGGASDISNAQPLCLSCNSSKGDKTTDYRTKPGLMRWIQDKLF